MGRTDERGHRAFAAVYGRLMALADRGWLGDARRALMAQARGDVLEIGAGTGINLRHLPEGCDLVLAEPDPAMRRRLEAAVRARGGRARTIAAPAEALPLPDASVDTVVATLVLCTVDDPGRALAEARRVLRPDGRLLFLEHVRADGRRGRWQDRLTPLHVRTAAGCRPNRDTVAMIAAAGFDVREMRRVREPRGLAVSAPVLSGSAAR
jgi:ubiquinone/menaquinone biosynthesis C-methylase UbiE